MTRYLSLHDLTVLYLSGHSLLWSRICQVTQEASFTHLFGAERDCFVDRRFLPFNPFPLLSTMRMLRTVKLQRLTLAADPETSPLAVLPPELDRLELQVEFWRNPLTGPSSPQLYRNFDFKSAFPQLRTLRMAFSEVSDDVQEHSLSLPSTLTALELHSGFKLQTILRCLSGDDTIDYLQWGPPPGTRSVAAAPSSTPPTHACAFPSLAVLDIAHRDCRLPPPFHLLPPRLLHFGWLAHPLPESWNRSPYDDYDPLNDESTPATGPSTSTSAPSANLSVNSAIGPKYSLRSVSLEEPSNLAADWLKECPRLTSINLRGFEWGMAPVLPLLPPKLEHLAISLGFLYNRLMQNAIVQSGVRLRSFDTKMVQQFTDENELLQLSNVLRSLSHLSILFPHLWILPMLPSTLTSLTLGYIKSSEIEALILGLPRCLLKLRLDAEVELGYLPLLPRSLRDLGLSVTNTMQIGTFHLLQADGTLPNDGLPYELIRPSSNIIFGLPPNLTCLNLSYRQKAIELDEIFGVFLPRSLQLLTTLQPSNVIIALKGKTTTASRLGYLLGLSERGKSVEQLVASFLRTLPAGCRSNFLIVTNGLLENKKVSLEALKKVCSPETAFISNSQ